ncbi:pyridoxal-phosphate dependent enzyme, partial [Rhodovulum sulfidophilum]|uniref:pyridoxal-phosphate dependent enzyme n=1 Tax=Rhodovulum sulfidophilum TaxID=35806 RepID=UPI001923B014
ARAPGFRVRPVEPEGFDDVTRSLASGRIETNTRRAGSLCDAIQTPAPGALTFPVMARLCGPGIAVTEDEALRAMAAAFERLRIVLEPGGAVALAAALYHPEAVAGEAVIAIGTGGNVSTETFRMALDRHGDAA